MDFFDNCYNLLNNVVSNKNTISYAIKENSKGKYAYEKANVVSLAGVFLRNYYFINACTKSIFNSTSEDDVLTLGILYVGVALKKYFSSEYALKKLTSHFQSKNIELTDYQIEQFNKLCEEKRQYKIPNLKVGTFSYFSASYNLPVWLIKMVFTQYGRDYLLPFMKAASRMPLQFAFKNKYVISENFNKNTENNFEEVAPDLYRFLHQTSIKKEDLVKDYSLLPVQQAPYLMMKNLPSFIDKNITFFLGYRTFDFFIPLSRYSENNNIIILEKEPKDNSEFLSRISKYPELKGVHRYQANEDGVVVYLDKPQDVIFYYAKSSSIESIRRDPEYSIIFDTNTLDSLIRNQEEGLKELAKYVNKDGYLIYAVNTINIKETIVRINNFLSINKNFKLEKEETFFPQDKQNSIYYFAILRKIK